MSATNWRTLMGITSQRMGRGQTAVEKSISRWKRREIRKKCRAAGLKEEDYYKMRDRLTGEPEVDNDVFWISSKAHESWLSKTITKMQDISKP